MPISSNVFMQSVYTTYKPPQNHPTSRSIRIRLSTLLPPISELLKSDKSLLEFPYPFHEEERRNSRKMISAHGQLHRDSLSCRPRNFCPSIVCVGLLRVGGITDFKS